MTVNIDLPEHFNIADYCIAPNLTPDRINRPFMVCEDQTLTYGDLDKGSQRAGNAFRKLGLQPEQRVMLLMMDTLQFPVCFWGAIRAGGVSVPVNILLKPPDYAYFLNDSRATISRIGSPGRPLLGL